MDMHPIRPNASPRKPPKRTDEDAALNIIVAGVVIAVSGFLAWFLAGVGLVALGDVPGMPGEVPRIGWLLVVGVPASLLLLLWIRAGDAS